ncbi:MAG: ATP-dependent RNA helicase DeaD [Bradymonadia bacterium]|jgi:ATP-dependent RNA helicase DeaD
MSDAPAPEPAQITFADLGLHPLVQAAVDAAGYEVPTPIQIRTIPPMLEGRDVLGQAQTGTGKTAAFALPLLSRIDLDRREVQALILAPTRELAIQVAEAVKTYAAKLPGFQVLPIYGGTAFDGQLRSLKRGVHVVVGTPGRVMDHMRRGTLSLKGLDTLVLDEADEMLRMGFIDDVKWVLEQAPEKRRIALFSATMPRVIKQIAEAHLNDPVVVQIEQKVRTAETVRQRCRVVPHHQKLDVLTRILETEPYDGMLIFVRTKNATVELADRLEARGIATAALSGDVPQRRREELVNALKKGRLDVLVATDVAARGLDVERLTHVVNYDPPHDTESYVHRIGRTGRAGRSGEAILFVTPRERHIVRNIERSTRQKIERLLLPTTDEVNALRLTKFKAGWADSIGGARAEAFAGIVEELIAEGHDPIELAKAAAALTQGDEPLLLDRPPRWEQDAVAWNNRHPADAGARDNNQGGGRNDRFDRNDRNNRNDRGDRNQGPPRGGRSGEEAMERYRLDVGHREQVRPGNIVGAIAGESGLAGNRIGRIDIQDDHTVIDLPAGMPPELFRRLSNAWVAGKQLALTKIGPGESGGARSHGPQGRSGNAGADRPRDTRPRFDKRPSSIDRPDGGESRPDRARPARDAEHATAPSEGPSDASSRSSRPVPRTPDGAYMKRPSATPDAPKKRGSKKKNVDKGKPKRK